MTPVKIEMRQRHEDGGARVDQDGDDEGRERGRRHIRQGGGPRAVVDEKVQAADRVDEPHEREVEDDDEGEEAEPAVALEGLGILEPDVEDARDEPSRARGGCGRRA